jgi:hypothetical protein
MGEDSSGNDNTWTPTNLSGTADVTTDTPTNNFATLNPLNSRGTLSEGNTKTAGANTDQFISNSNIGVSTGKWYVEAKMTALSGGQGQFGITGNAGEQNRNNRWTGQDTYSYGLASNDGLYYNASVQSGSWTTYTTGDILSIALDLDNNLIYFYKNGTVMNSGTGFSITDPANQPDGNYFFAVSDGNSSYSATWEMNFGNAPFSISSGNSDGNGYGNFEYAPPSGYLALCTQNLATALSPTIDDGSQYFNTVLYTGDGSNPRSLTGVGFQPDFTWIKNRTDAWGHGLADSTRGGGKTLITNATAVEQINYTWGYVNSFDSDGFTVNAGASGDDFVNQTSDNYVSWNWLANGGTTSSNTDGSITSTVQANTTAGFSIVTYTGTGSNATVGHGLGKAPVYIITKSRSNGSGVWWQYHQGLSGTDKVIHFSTGAEQTASTVFQGTAPTSSVFSVGTNFNINESGGSQLAYCFAEIEGYSKFGSYTGNGSTDGTFVYTGFRPAWIMIKASSTTSNWTVFDKLRDGYNVENQSIYANLSATESTADDKIDLVSNGFKLRASAQGVNDSSDTFIYMAFSANPFVTSGATPVTAR